MSDLSSRLLLRQRAEDYLLRRILSGWICRTHSLPRWVA
jgi:hypothetical protein